MTKIICFIRGLVLRGIGAVICFFSGIFFGLAALIYAEQKKPGEISSIIAKAAYPDVEKIKIKWKRRTKPSETYKSRND